MGIDLIGPRLRSLLVTGLAVGALSVAFAAETKTETPVMRDLRLAAGKVTGRVEDQPLVDVLERLSQLQPFGYSGSPALLERKVSKVFAGVSVSDAVRRTLDGYDYYVLSNANGVILELTVTNFSGEAPGGRETPAYGMREAPQNTDDPPRVRLPLAEFPIPVVTAAPGVPLSEAERASFEAGIQEGPPPGFYETFYPETPPDAVLSGPSAPPGFVAPALPYPDHDTTLTGPGTLN